MPQWVGVRLVTRFCFLFLFLNKQTKTKQNPTRKTETHQKIFQCTLRTSELFIYGIIILVEVSGSKKSASFLKLQPLQLTKHSLLLLDQDETKSPITERKRHFTSVEISGTKKIIEIMTKIRGLGLLIFFFICRRQYFQPFSPETAFIGCRYLVSRRS